MLANEHLTLPPPPPPDSRCIILSRRGKGRRQVLPRQPPQVSLSERAIITREERNKKKKSSRPRRSHGCCPLRRKTRSSQHFRWIAEREREREIKVIIGDGSVQPSVQVLPPPRGGEPSRCPTSSPEGWTNQTRQLIGRYLTFVFMHHHRYWSSRSPRGNKN